MPTLRDIDPLRAPERDSSAHDLLVPGLPTRVGARALIAIEVRCEETANGWSCTIRLRDGERQVSSHVVRVRAEALRRLDPGTADPTDLVRRSFAFLLDREPPSSILRTFDLLEIGRYFPEYEASIRRGPRPA